MVKQAVRGYEANTCSSRSRLGPPIRVGKPTTPRKYYGPQGKRYAPIWSGFRVGFRRSVFRDPTLSWEERIGRSAPSLRKVGIEVQHEFE